MERETALEIGVGGVGVGGFILALLAVGTVYGDGALSSEGGLVMIGVIVGFVLVMTGLGHWLTQQRD